MGRQYQGPPNDTVVCCVCYTAASTDSMAHLFEQTHYTGISWCRPCFAAQREHLLVQPVLASKPSDDAPPMP